METDKVDKFELNLGPFSDRVEMLDDEWAEFRYCSPSGHQRMFYYRDRDTVDSAPGDASVTVPTFELRDLGHVESNDALGIEEDGCREELEKLIMRVEFRVITMIYDLAHKFNVDLQLGNVVIPVKSKVCGFLPNGYPLVKMSLGIAIFGVKGKTLPRRARAVRPR